MAFKLQEIKKRKTELGRVFSQELYFLRTNER